MSASAREVTDDDFDDVVRRAGRPVLVDFWAPWCGPCRVMGPILDAMAEAHEGTLDIVKVNLDESPETARRFGVSSIPALLLFSGGQLLTTLVGAKPRTLIEKAIADHL
ncbi:thioredoxin [Streptomyces sp. NPDC101234]|uniref:thioredoxin n=1 Tax=Streptomyces sp. NPDC101234 TaxID=3366138 RepID=UPI003811A9F8